TGQRAHVAGTEHIAYQPVGLVHGKGVAIDGGNTRRILATVLQQKKRIVDELVDGGMRDYADNATHGGLLNQMFKTEFAAPVRRADRAGSYALLSPPADSASPRSIPAGAEWRSGRTGSQPLSRLIRRGPGRIGHPARD